MNKLVMLLALVKAAMSDSVSVASCYQPFQVNNTLNFLTWVCINDCNLLPSLKNMLDTCNTTLGNMTQVTPVGFFQTKQLCLGYVDGADANLYQAMLGVSENVDETFNCLMKAMISADACKQSNVNVGAAIGFSVLFCCMAICAGVVKACMSDRRSGFSSV